MTLRDLTARLERDHSNRMWCRAVHLCVCVQERGSSVLGVVGLTHTCVRVCAEGGCPSDSALHGRE